MFEHKEDKSGTTTEAEWWGAAPWDRGWVETDRETERNNSGQISHPLCPLCSPSLSQDSSFNPIIPPLHPSHPSPVPSLPFSQRSSAQLPSLPTWVSVCGIDAGEWSRLASHQLRVPLLNGGQVHIPFQRTSRGRCNARVQEEMGSSNRWHPHDSPVYLEFRPKDQKMDTK